MNEYLYVLRARRLEMLTEGPTPEEQAIVGRHFAHLQRLTEEGVMVLVGRTANDDEHAIGIAVFRAADDAGAEVIMASDPAIAEGVMTGTLFPFRIALRGE